MQRPDYLREVPVTTWGDVDLPPHNLLAEQALLGGCMVAPARNVPQATAKVAVADFYADKHGAIWQAILECWSEHGAVDPVAVAHLLRGDKLDACGGFDYLVKLQDSNPLSGEVAPHAAIIADLAKRRRLQEAFLREYAAAGDVEQSVAEVACRIREAADETADGSVAEGDQLVAQWTERSTFTCRPISTGYSELDEMLGDGWRRPQFHLLSAPPKAGKSALICSWINAAARAGRKVGLLSLEMGSHEVMSRLVAIRSGIAYRDVEMGYRVMREVSSLRRAAVDAMDAAISLAPYVAIDDSRGYSPAEMVSRLLTLRRQHGCDLLIVDLLNKVRGEGNDVHTRAADVCRHLDDACCEAVLGVPVIAVAQQNREGNVKNAADFEESACAILTIKRVVDADGETTGELKLVEQRGGPTGVVRLDGDVRTMAWHEEGRRPMAREEMEADPWYSE